jgi:cation diffusion facilitator CzcD-associated flavoprotein CzcO
MANSDVAVIGAGPYGLSAAAHLRHRGVDFRIFGVPMANWRNAMPAGMFLKSDGAGTSLSDPENAVTLARYCSRRGIPYADHGLPIALETFVNYALAFQQQLGLNVEPCNVVELAGEPGLFKLQLDTGETVTARKVVLAVGTTYFGHVPIELANLPRELVTHSRDHRDFARFAGKEVVVVGGGQSSLETAALLNEQGAKVQVLVRRPSVAWNPPPTEASGLRRLYEVQTGLGVG